MNLLIVEDEPRLLNSLAFNIPWEEHGIQLVGTASNGLAAVRMIERKKPDILLLDVQIPEIDGLTIAKSVHEQDPLIKIIVLSGHDNFTYAQTALEIGVSKYLLKPAGEEEILSTVLNAAEQRRGELDKLHTREILEHKWQQHLPYLQNNFFNSWLTGKYEGWEIARRSADLQIPLPEGEQYTVAVVQMDPLPDEETRFRKEDMSLLQFSLNSLAKESTEKEPCWVCADSTGDTMLIFYAPPETDTGDLLLLAHTAVSRLLSTVKSCLKLTASAGISNASSVKTELPLLYAQAGRALQNRMLYGEDIAIPFREDMARSLALPVRSGAEKNLEIALETGDEAKAMETLADLWRAGAETSQTLDDVREVILSLSSLLVRIIHNQGWHVREAAGGESLYFHHLQQLVTREQIYVWLQNVVKSVVDYGQKQRKSANHKLIGTILSMIENELHKEITLNTVADRLYINSSYLSRLFKQETGKPFSVYVTERKMDRAKALLLEGAKVYDAAHSVGYRDVSYFTKVFRKYWGITPGEMKA